MEASLSMENPRCYGMEELPTAVSERGKVLELLRAGGNDSDDPLLRSLLFVHLSHGLAYTAGSALGCTPPSVETCLSAFLVPNKAGLTAGARAWSKHSHRSLPQDEDEGDDDKSRREASAGWWGIPAGPVAIINENALALFHKVMDNATWRNLHWLPHRVLVYEVRVVEGYGMRCSQDRSNNEDEEQPWYFRGYVEPMMENGHQVGWRH